jgi:hypothetical protein
MTKKVAAGEFVKRQTPESGFSHFEGSWETLEKMTENVMRFPHCVRQGYKDGVLLVDLDPFQFRSAIVRLDEKSKISATYSPRRLGEAPFIRLGVKANKQPAKYASVVLYRADVLEENNERQTDAEWEIVCVKARVTEEEEPMDPYTMARNFLHLKGGTKGDFTAEQFAQSIVYWNNHTMTTGKPKWYRKLAAFFRQVLADMREGARMNAENMRDGGFK